MPRQKTELPTDLDLLYAYLEEVEADLARARQIDSMTAVGALHRLRLEIAKQIEDCEKSLRESNQELPEEEFLAELESDARQMPDAHLRPFAEEYARRLGNVLPPAPEPV